MEGGQGGMGVVGAPDQGVRVDRRRVDEGDAAQVVADGPDERGLFADEGGQGGGGGDGVEQRLDAEVRADRVDDQTEGVRQRLVVGGPLGAGRVPGHPDPVARELGRGDRGGVGVRVARPGEQVERFVEDRGGRDPGGQPVARHGHGAERRVDGAVPDRRHGRAGVEERDDVQLRVGMGPVEAPQQARQRELPPDHVDAQRPAARPHRGGGPLGGPEQRAGVRQERLSVEGEPRSARVPVEEADAQLPFQGGHALGHRLGRDREVDRGFLELPGLRDGDEGAYGGEIHADQRTSDNRWLIVGAGCVV
ncbi:hypothetical protein EES47_11455 [Streptomyces sp. ADI98-12]|nr:hypothetical protein EES47_11455 [Streptomyces sp. ADI98-12]